MPRFLADHPRDRGGRARSIACLPYLGLGVVDPGYLLRRATAAPTDSPRAARLAPP